MQQIMQQDLLQDLTGHTRLQWSVRKKSQLTCAVQAATHLGVPEWAPPASLPSSGLQRASCMRLSKQLVRLVVGRGLEHRCRVRIHLTKDTQRPELPSHSRRSRDLAPKSPKLKGGRKFHRDAVAYVSQVHDRKCVRPAASAARLAASPPSQNKFLQGSCSASNLQLPVCLR